jgi:3-hydroxybutyrate dehydrogenase
MASGSKRVALVTGSTSGIGLAISKALAPKVDVVVVNGFATEEQRKEAIAAVQKAGSGTRVEYHGADLTKPNEIRDMVEFCVKEFGKTPDILVNNAGCQHVSPIEGFSDEKWDQLIAVNLSASFHTIKHILPGMKERGWGCIINIASVHGLVASVNKAAYCASKFGLVGLTKNVALETAGSGVTCNAICPGFVLTPLVHAQFQDLAVQQGISIEEAKDRAIAQKQPSKKPTTPEDIGEIVCFLCSPASNQITGSTLTVDGGWTAQ